MSRRRPRARHAARTARPGPGDAAAAAEALVSALALLAEIAVAGAAVGAAAELDGNTSQPGTHPVIEAYPGCNSTFARVAYYLAPRAVEGLGAAGGSANGTNSTNSSNSSTLSSGTQQQEEVSVPSSTQLLDLFVSSYNPVAALSGRLTDCMGGELQPLGASGGVLEEAGYVAQVFGEANFAFANPANVAIPPTGSGGAADAAEGKNGSSSVTIKAAGAGEPINGSKREYELWTSFRFEGAAPPYACAYDPHGIMLFAADAQGGAIASQQCDPTPAGHASPGAPSSPPDANGTEGAFPPLPVGNSSSVPPPENGQQEVAATTPQPTPTRAPIEAPTAALRSPEPIAPTPSPSRRPSPSPTKSPTTRPTPRPTPTPTKSPTMRPTRRPTPSPTDSPSKSPMTSLFGMYQCERSSCGAGVPLASGCHCDKSCVTFGDCCADACTECGACEGEVPTKAPRANGSPTKAPAPTKAPLGWAVPTDAPSRPPQRASEP